MAKKGNPINLSSGGGVDEDTIANGSVDQGAEPGQVIKDVVESARFLENFKSDLAVLKKNMGAAEDKIKKQENEINALGKKIEAAAGSENRSVEIIGVISSIIALVLVFTSVSVSPKISLARAYFILLTISASLVLFASLIHSFFSSKKISRWYIFTSICLPIAIIIVVGYLTVFVFDDESNIKTDTINTSTSTTVGG